MTLEKLYVIDFIIENEIFYYRINDRKSLFSTTKEILALKANETVVLKDW